MILLTVKREWLRVDLNDERVEVWWKKWDFTRDETKSYISSNTLVHILAFFRRKKSQIWLIIHETERERAKERKDIEHEFCETYGNSPRQNDLYNPLFHYTNRPAECIAADHSISYNPIRSLEDVLRRERFCIWWVSCHCQRYEVKALNW